MAELKKTKDVLLKTKDSLLKTEDVLLKTKDGPSVNRKLLTHILTNIPTYTQTSNLDDYNKLSLCQSLKSLLSECKNFLFHVFQCTTVCTNALRVSCCSSFLNPMAFSVPYSNFILVI